MRSHDISAGSLPPSEFSAEVAAERIERLLRGEYGFSRRAVALLLLQGDAEIEALIAERDAASTAEIRKIVDDARSQTHHPLEYVIASRRQLMASEIASKVVTRVGERREGIGDALGRLTIEPWTGIPILLLVLYWGLYKFVGGFGAGVLVDLVERRVFDHWLTPLLRDSLGGMLTWKPIYDLLIGDYGVLTMGLRYALGIVMPIVAVFFLAFSILEDTGYLPRLALLIDRLFKVIGLSGRAVIPMVLGLGCDTMATMVTRTLPTRRERLIATILLALAVPCSAQLGVILALLEGKPAAMLVWTVSICLVFMFVGLLGSLVLPGETPSFYMEVPPLRLPQVSNVLIKTFSRIVWYLKEVLPIFVIASLLIWIADLCGGLTFAAILLEHPLQLAGLPQDAANVFIFGFFRRDYGAAGLYDLADKGLLDGRQLAVACVALTLFLPCVAQFIMNVKERGLATGLGISAFVLVFSFAAACLLNMTLLATGLRL